MEILIIVSVLSTLSVVALVSTIVVMFIKLNKKVDVTENNQHRDEVYREMSQRDEEIRRLIIEVNNNIASQLDNVYREIEDTKKFIDSRCDKLDNKIINNGLASVSKKILKG